MSDLITLTIDGKSVQVPKGSTVMQACKALNIEIPHFCYHERLSIAGNCRMCLVEVEKAPKPVASCHWPVAEGMVVHTTSKTTTDARKGVMEMLLINHPLDCPICDQGGECDLQDVAVSYGSDRSRFHEIKRAVDDKDIGPLINTVMTRCIHCTRCIRFATEIAGVEEFGATGRGEQMSVGTYVEKALESELSGNMIDLCPVGALTSKPYAFAGRPWELESTPSIDVMDAVGSHITIHHRAGAVMRILPRECAEINEEWIADTARFSYDGLRENRLTTPLVRKNGQLAEVGWPEAFAALVPALKKARSVAGALGALQTTEESFAFGAFLKGYFSASAVSFDSHVLAAVPRSHRVLNMSLPELETADVIVLIGCNPRFEAPLVNLRLRKAVLKNKAQVLSIGAPMDLRYKHTQVSATPQTLLDGAQSKITKALQGAKRPVVLVGAQVLAREDALAIISAAQKIILENNGVREGWNGFGVLHSSAGFGGMSDMLGAIATPLPAQTDILWLYGDSTQALTTTAKHRVYMGTHLTELAKTSDIILPASTYTEKDGWYVNVEGRVQAAHKAVNPPLQAKEDWKIFRALSAELGQPLPFDTLNQLRAQVVEKGGEPYRAIGERVLNAWVPLAGVGEIQNTPFTQPDMNFYQSNEILRHSKTMAQCQQLTDERATERKVA